MYVRVSTIAVRAIKHLVDVASLLLLSSLQYPCYLGERIEVFVKAVNLMDTGLKHEGVG
jgi:hypothetical protein